MPTTSDQPSNYQPIRFIVNDPGFDTELGLKGRGYSPDNGQTFIVQDTTDGRIYRVKDAKRLFPLLKPLFDPYYSGGTASLHWSDILDKPELATEDDLKKIELTPGPPGKDGSDGKPGKDGQNGVSPHIDSTTGHWFIGTTDTGVSARGPQGQPGKDGAPGRDGKDATDTVQVITSGTLASLGIGKYEIQESASDAPTDDWGLLEVTVGQHYAKQVFTITGNGRNMIYSRVRDYDAADYGPWHAISNTIDTSSKTTNKLPSDYQDGIFYEVKSVSSVGINRSDSDWSAQQGTTAILTTKVYDGSAIQTAEIIDGTRPIVYMRVGQQSTWYAWEANTTW